MTIVDRIGRERVEIVVGAVTVAFGKRLGDLLIVVALYVIVAAIVGTVVIARAATW